jgi:hypothetical protein
MGTVKIRLGLAAIAVAILAMPFGVSHADHCTKRVVLFSGRAALNAGFATCFAGEEDPNTDYVLPDTRQILIRWTESAEPLGTSTLTFAGVGASSRCTAGVGCTIKWSLTDTGLGSIVWDSQPIPVTSDGALSGGDATVHVCQDAGDLDCDDRTYTTLG